MVVGTPQSPHSAESAWYVIVPEKGPPPWYQFGSPSSVGTIGLPCPCRTRSWYIGPVGPSGVVPSRYVMANGCSNCEPLSTWHEAHTSSTASLRTASGTVARTALPPWSNDAVTGRVDELPARSPTMTLAGNGACAAVRWATTVTDTPSMSRLRS